MLEELIKFWKSKFPEMSQKEAEKMASQQMYFVKPPKKSKNKSPELKTAKI